MATQVVDVGNDADLMAAALAPEPVDTPVEDKQDGQPRDEHGRFARAEEPEPTVETPPSPAAIQQEAKPEEAHVPSWRLRDVREELEGRIKARDAELEAERRARQQYENQLRQFQAQQQQTPPPDMYADPDKWQQHLRQQQKAEVDNVRYQLSEDFARDKYGDEKVNAALSWVQSNMDPAVQARIQNARSPFRELVRLYDERQTLQQIGGDLNAYRSKVRDEALNDPEFMKMVAEKLRGQPQANSVVDLPPSLNRASGGATRATSDAGDMSDANLYAYATAKRR